MHIRPALADDWPAIWPFFREIVEAGETYAYDPALTSEAAKSLWLEASPGHAVVAVVDDMVLGSAKMGPNRPGRGAHIATASFMVSADARGHGVGRALGEYFVRWARDHEFRGMQFNAVVETNLSAVRLWQSLGFDILTTVPAAFDSASHGLVGLHVMYQRL